jgi:hypothetical protein
MAIQNPILNPIRFYDPTQLPNYGARWPNIDNVSMFTEWQKGVYASKFYRDHRLNEEITFQFRYDSAITDQEIDVYKLDPDTGLYSISETLVPTDVTPSTWTGLNVYNYSWTPSETGVFYLDFDDADLLSDRVIVHSEDKFLKRLVEIKYYHYENRYSMVYYKDGGQVFTGVAYFQGNLLDGEPTNEISEFTDDPGEVELLRATPQRTGIVSLEQLHYSYTDLINYIFSNSEIYINGIKYQNKEVPRREVVPESDLRNFTIGVFQRDNEHFRN